MKTLSLSQGKETIVCDCHYTLVASHKWFFSCGYAARSVYGQGKKLQTLGMHRAIINAQQGQIVDHINGDKLDNRCINLRLVNNYQNSINQGLQKNNKSGHIGVYQHTRSKKWVAQISVERKQMYLGLFKDIKDAITAYEMAAKEHYGKYYRQLP